ncbi:T6SS amidase immunity protein Tai4 family protein [Pinibacter aurantiacus]|uniref:Type VI secretion system amidase immunity protein Tai4 n=1 Tax=Pinibacter aurantiacus TaxID=2851599 RepID=A0A9E2S7E6_9BACT|nr:T6SS amidase immunity protein Tai4 family protein [Pinibacter aurantiacus]MBV4356353.1 type VI secretion system amidase immunity protein Tai4 [Pinibacter aurantiacus]
MKSIFFRICMVALVVGCASSKNNEIRLSSVYKDYVFYKCIQEAFPNDSIYNKDISETVLMEMSNYAIMKERSGKMDSIAKAFVNSIQPTQIADYENKKPLFLRCLEFYKSKELDKFVKKLAKETPKF